MRDKPAVRKKREFGEVETAQCPACNAPLKIPAGKLRHKVQCPRCRTTVEPVDIGENEDTPEAAMSAEPELRQRLERQEAQIREMEARLRQLEELVKNPPVASEKPEVLPEPEPELKMRWLAGETLPDYSEIQAEVLGHNLRGIRREFPMRVECAAGNPTAKVRAEWFARIFASANWEVRGPEETHDSRVLGSDVSLVTSLPVSPDSAAIFLAIRAAGFEVSAVYTAEGNGSGDRLVCG